MQTSIAARALDGLKDVEMRKDVVAYLLRYLDTDTVWRVDISLQSLIYAPAVRANATLFFFSQLPRNVPGPPRQAAGRALDPVDRVGRKDLRRQDRAVREHPQYPATGRDGPQTRLDRVRFRRLQARRCVPTFFFSEPGELAPSTQRLNCSIHTAFERAVLASKSYLIALGLVEGFLSVDDAAKAAHVEVQSQIDRWGEVEDSEWEVD